VLQGVALHLPLVLGFPYVVTRIIKSISLTVGNFVSAFTCKLSFLVF
jgi:hypothetical protein